MTKIELKNREMGGTAGFSPAWLEGIMPLSCAASGNQLNLPQVSC
jgi:hypothetical protein